MSIAEFIRESVLKPRLKEAGCAWWWTTSPIVTEILHCDLVVAKMFCH